MDKACLFCLYMLCVRESLGDGGGEKTGRREVTSAPDTAVSESTASIPEVAVTPVACITTVSSSTSTILVSSGR